MVQPECGEVAAFYAVDGWLSVNDGAPARGREAIATVARGFMGAFPDLQVSMVKLSMSMGKPVYHWRLTGSNTGPGGAGKKVDIGGQEEWLMDADGLIAESRGQFNVAEYQRQLESGVG